MPKANVDADAFRKEWEYQFRSWEPQFGSPAVALVKQEDRSEAYEQDSATLFRLENGKYALVTESGCSCYEYSDASIEVFPTELAALAAFDKWRR